MSISTRLKIWTLYVLPVVAATGMCPGNGGCQVRQLGSPQYTTMLLQCNGPACQSAIFAPSPSMVCLIRSNGGSNVRVYLNSCSQFSGNSSSYLLKGASVVPSLSGQNIPNTTFQDTSCGTLCEAIEVVIYKSNGLALVAQNSQVATSSNTSCDRGFYVYPNVIPYSACSQIGPTTSKLTGPTGASESTGRAKRQIPSQTRQLALLTVTDGVSVFAVGAPERLGDGSDYLPIVEQPNGQVFFIQQYLSQAVGASGDVELVTAYTLRIPVCGKYLVADVLNDTTLNYAGPNTTGLNLANATDFSAGYATTADYRFFVRYDVNVSGLNATVFCPLFHRNHCLRPTVSGYLRLTPLRSADLSVEPTFVNPTNQELWDFVSSLVGPWHVALRVI